MTLCASCGVNNSSVEICAHHHSIYYDDWAAGNRAFCDWLHRGIMLPRLPEDQRQDDDWLGLPDVA